MSSTMDSDYIIAIYQESTPSSSLPLSGGIPTVLAGFTPTVASITEQISLEIVEASDHVHGTANPPPPTSKPVSSPPDVVYDEHGQTWDVYGAEFDPIILDHSPSLTSPSVSHLVLSVGLD